MIRDFTVLSLCVRMRITITITITSCGSAYRPPIKIVITIKKKALHIHRTRYSSIKTLSERIPAGKARA